MRGIPAGVPLGPDEGLAQQCAATLDTIQPIRRTFLTERVSALDALRRQELCAALRALADC